MPMRISVTAPVALSSLLASALYAGCGGRIDTRSEITRSASQELQAVVQQSNYEPTLAINPVNPANIVGGASGYVEVSMDNGATWTSPNQLNLPTSPSENSGGDNSFTFDSQGRLFAAHIGTYTAPPPGNQTTWDQIVTQINPYTGQEISGTMTNVTGTSQLNHTLTTNDKGWLAADRYTGHAFPNRLYLAWTDTGSNAIYAAYSDGGATGPWKWTNVSGNPPGLVSLASEGSVWGTHVAIAANGDVYVAYHSQTGTKPFTASGKPFVEPDGTTGKVVLLKATPASNGTVTFSQRTLPYGPGQADVTLNEEPSGFRLIPNNADWCLGTVQPWIVPSPQNPNNVGVVADDDTTNGGATPDESSYIIQSANKGSSFGTITQVNSAHSGSQAGTQSFFPTAAADYQMPCTAVMYWDNRGKQPDSSGTDWQLDTYVRGTTDGVNFGPEVKLDQTALDGDLNAQNAFSVTPASWRIGEYNGVAVHRGVAHGIWTTTSSGNQVIAHNLVRVCSDSEEPPSGGNVAAARQSTNVTAAFSFGSDGALYDRQITYASGTGVRSEPLALTAGSTAPSGAAIATGAQSSTQLDVFYVGNDHKVQYVWEQNDGAWQAATDLPGQPSNFAPPGAHLATANASGQLGVAVVDNNGAVDILWWNPLLGWLGPVPITGTNYAPPGATLALVWRYPNELDLFAIGSEGALKFMAFNGTNWSGPTYLTLGSFAPPGGGVATAFDVHGFLNVFTVGNDGNLYTKWDSTNLWSGPTALTGGAVPGGGVSAVNLNNSSLNVFYVDTAGNLNVMANGGFSWAGPSTAASNIAAPGAPSAVASESSSQEDVFFVQNGLGVSEYTNFGSLVMLP